MQQLDNRFLISAGMMNNLQPSQSTVLRLFQKINVSKVVTLQLKNTGVCDFVHLFLLQLLTGPHNNSVTIGSREGSCEIRHLISEESQWYD